jgi:hypothetical protein
MLCALQSSVAGTSMFANPAGSGGQYGVQKVPQSNFDGCANYCKQTAACQFVEFQYTTSSCYAFQPPLAMVNAANSVEVFYKLPPSNDIRATAKAATLSATNSTKAAPVVSGPAGSASNSSRKPARPTNVGSGMYAKYVFNSAGNTIPWAATTGTSTYHNLAAAADACDADYRCVAVTKLSLQLYELRFASQQTGARTIISAEKQGDDVTMDSARIVQPGRFDRGEQPLKRYMHSVARHLACAWSALVGYGEMVMLLWSNTAT